MEAKFQNHMAEFGLSYITADEFNFRMSLFAAKDAWIIEQNARETSFEVGHNKFSTWTDDEYNRLLGHSRIPDEVINAVPDTDEVTRPLADGIDWREHKGIVQSVKDQ